MKRIITVTLTAVLLSTCLQLAGVSAKRFDSASPLAKDNGTSEESLKVDTAGHADYVKSQDNSTTTRPKEDNDRNEAD